MADLPDYPTQLVASDIADAMRAGEYSEDLWQEIERMLLSRETADRDAVEDMTLSAIIDTAAMKRAQSPISAAAVDAKAAQLVREHHDAECSALP